MHTFVRNLITEWRRLNLPFEAKTVVIGVSGGADSVSLLLALYELTQREKLKLRLVGAHFNHGLRGAESESDEDFVRMLATERGIELAIGRESVSKKTGNLEQNARDARYDFMAKTASNVGAFAMLTGHTVNDQAETFLMNLIRGSGADGLAGMRPVRTLASKLIPRKSDLAPQNSKLILVRPMLTWANRGDTQTYCRDLGVEYRYDTMNEDTAFKRVRIRKILLPLLQDFNPKIVETLANTASLMQYLPETGETGKNFFFPNELKLAELKDLAKSELYAKIRSWLRQHRGTTRRLTLKHIEGIERLIFSQKSGKMAELPGGRVTKTGGRLVYDENKVEN